MSGWTNTSAIGTAASATAPSGTRTSSAPLRAVGEEAGEEEREQHLPELGRLEGEEADVDPAPRPARRGARDEHERHHPERADVDHRLEPPVDGRVDQHHADHHDRADAGVQRLPAAEAPARVVLGDPADRPDPEPDDRGDGREQHPVHAARAARRGRRPPPRGGAGARGHGCRPSRTPSVAKVRGQVAALVEVLLEDLERRRGRRDAAVAAVLDHGADDDRRLVERAPAAPPRLVELQRLLLCREP